MLASEVNTLVRMLERVSESHRDSRDFTVNDLRRVLVEVIATFRVYRTYIQPGEPVSSRDREYIETAVARARKRLPTVDRLVFDFVRDALLLNVPTDANGDVKLLWEKFVVRFQQTTGPVQAKGLEDTTFYRQVALISLNEVGGDPSRWGVSPASFHALNALKLADWPGSFSTTATHDTKRGEDARIRINVISELGDEWKTRLARWARWNARKRTVVNEVECPDSREEYLFYQSLVGAWPFDHQEAISHDFVARMQGFMIKAASEAKRNTDWTDPDSSYKDRLAKFVSEVLEGPDATPFLDDFRAFQRKVTRVGIVHSLSQSVLKVASPGVADVYQGCEFWDLNLVDPDNRRPVDYESRIETLGKVASALEGAGNRAKLAADLFLSPENGAIKQFVLWTALNHRKKQAELYQRGTYRAIEVSGERKENIVAFLRNFGDQFLIAVVPRLVAGLIVDEGATSPLPAGVWGNSELLIPDKAPARWRNLITDEPVEVSQADGLAKLRLAEIFKSIPLGLLVAESR